MKKLLTLALTAIVGLTASAYTGKQIVIPENMQPVTELTSGKNY